MSAIVPIPRVNLSVRPATMGDLSFIDALQKQHTKQVGWMPTQQLEGKIRLGHVLVAEEVGTTDYADLNFLSAQSAQSAVPTPVGYVIGNDQYFKRDDVGIIYQLNVMPTKRRSLVGATLIQAMFDRAAYGCRLFCCWCAQDIEANHFWESIGFVPLAFRTGSRTKGAKRSPRVHIFWQKRIRADDCETPWWFPSQTSSGSIREDRLVFPIPPGVHWSEEMPRVLPAEAKDEVPPRRVNFRMKDEPRAGTKGLPGPRQAAAPTAKAPGIPPTAIRFGGLNFTCLQTAPAEPKPRRESRRAAMKNDPKLVAAARELRDRWLEQVNAGDYLPQSASKYEVSRQLDAPAAPRADVPLPQLPVAA